MTSDSETAENEQERVQALVDARREHGYCPEHNHGGSA